MGGPGGGGGSGTYPSLGRVRPRTRLSLWSLIYSHQLCSSWESSTSGTCRCQSHRMEPDVKPPSLLLLLGPVLHPSSCFHVLGPSLGRHSARMRYRCTWEAQSHTVTPVHTHTHLPRTESHTGRHSHTVTIVGSPGRENSTPLHGPCHAKSLGVELAALQMLVPTLHLCDQPGTSPIPGLSGSF